MTILLRRSSVLLLTLIARWSLSSAALTVMDKKQKRALLEHKVRKCIERCHVSYSDERDDVMLFNKMFSFFHFHSLYGRNGRYPTSRLRSKNSMANICSRASAIAISKRTFIAFLFLRRTPRRKNWFPLFLRTTTPRVLPFCWDGLLFFSSSDFIRSRNVVVAP